MIDPITSEIIQGILFLGLCAWSVIMCIALSDHE